MRQGLTKEQVLWAEAIEHHFDEIFYLKTYPHLRHQPMAAHVHYVTEGWRKNYDPTPWFSNAGYKALHRDVGNKMPPFVHYVVYGRFEGRKIMATQHVALPATPAPPKTAKSHPMGPERQRSADPFEHQSGAHSCDSRVQSVEDDPPGGITMRSASDPQSGRH